MGPVIDRRILIADLAYLGDTLMTTPVITNLRRNHPRAMIDFLASSQSSIVVKHHPDLNEVIVVDKAEWQRNRWKDLDALAGRLREKRYDLAYLVHRSARTAVLAWRAGIPKRVGLATQGRASLLTHPVPLDASRHRTDNALALLEATGEHISTRGLSFTPAPGAYARAEGLLLSHHWDPTRPLIALAPGGSWDTKCWPLGRFARVARALDEVGYQVAVVGGPDDLTSQQELIAQAGIPMLGLAGQTTFDELYEIFQRCQGVIANDSGPMHLAAAAGIPLVGVFGPTSPGRCGPRSEVAEVVAGEVPCLGCYFRECAHHSCMELLGVRTVLEALDRAMRRAGVVTIEPEPEELVPAPV